MAIRGKKTLYRLRALLLLVVCSPLCCWALPSSPPPSPPPGQPPPPGPPAPPRPPAIALPSGYSLYGGNVPPIGLRNLGCVTSWFDQVAITPNAGGSYGYIVAGADSMACRAWKLAATVCNSAPVLYSTAALG